MQSYFADVTVASICPNWSAAKSVTRSSGKLLILIRNTIIFIDMVQVQILGVLLTLI